LKGILEEFRKLCYKFTWTRDNKKKRLVPASYNKLTAPKENGGWGVKKL
jgi:hypothetical protein